MLKPLHHQHTGLLPLWLAWIVAAALVARAWGWV